MKSRLKGFLIRMVELIIIVINWCAKHGVSDAIVKSVINAIIKLFFEWLFK